ncbi:MAG: hypothetical protein ACT443_02220, partial [Gemmatimonadota bacterium]
MSDPGAGSFGEIKAIAVADDGRIAVLESQAQEIRVFSPTGQHLLTHGRKGAGPGEFRGAWGMMQGRDGRLRIPDYANARLSLIDLDSGFIASH